ncbi:MAG: hypothetical protein K0Q93_2131 [Nocardioidaceae bacterium]|nr:hypothetical protein [Nocardioidaceae bacterium]
MHNLLTSVIRTGLPYAWAWLATYLSTLGVVDQTAAAGVVAWGESVTSAVVLAAGTALYVLARLVETRVPAALRKLGVSDEIAGPIVRVLTTLLLGTPAAPVYPGAAAAK